MNSIGNPYQKTSFGAAYHYKVKPGLNWERVAGIMNDLTIKHRHEAHIDPSVIHDSEQSTIHVLTGKPEETKGRRYTTMESEVAGLEHSIDTEELESFVIKSRELRIQRVSERMGRALQKIRELPGQVIDMTK